MIARGGRSGRESSCAECPWGEECDGKRRMQDWGKGAQRIMLIRPDAGRDVHRVQELLQIQPQKQPFGKHVLRDSLQLMGGRKDALNMLCWERWMNEQTEDGNGSSVTSLTDTGSVAFRQMTTLMSYPLSLNLILSVLKGIHNDDEHDGSDSGGDGASSRE